MDPVTGCVNVSILEQWPCKLRLPGDVALVTVSTLFDVCTTQKSPNLHPSECICVIKECTAAYDFYKFCKWQLQVSPLQDLVISPSCAWSHHSHPDAVQGVRTFLQDHWRQKAKPSGFGVYFILCKTLCRTWSLSTRFVFN